jgi:hypothetical protein
MAIGKKKEEEESALLRTVAGSASANHHTTLFCQASAHRITENQRNHAQIVKGTGSAWSRTGQIELDKPPGRHDE